jgi:2-(1,2-epoxy-1,2-dihydrophenyl)acetyl-CoA isomerase
MTMPEPDGLQALRLEAVDEHRVWIVLDRPQVLNAMSVAMRHELLAVLDHLATTSYRVVLLRGEGRNFSAGADLKEFPQEVDVRDPAQVRASVDGWHEAIRRLRDLPQASVAAVHGPTYGGGANLALAADVVLAAESTRLVQSYVDIGASVDLGGSWLLPRLAGAAIGRRLLLTGEPVDGRLAAQLGLVSEVVPDDRLLDRALELADILAAKDPSVLRMIRRTIHRGAATDLDTHLDVEAEGVAELLAGDAFRAATDRFADGTSP